MAKTLNEQGDVCKGARPAEAFEYLPEDPPEYLVAGASQPWAIHNEKEG